MLILIDIFELHFCRIQQRITETGWRIVIPFEHGNYTQHLSSHYKLQYTTKYITISYPLRNSQKGYRRINHNNLQL